MNIKFHELALAEYEDAVDWYFERSPNAANNFEKQVEVTIQFILDRPTMFSLLENNLRKASVEHYPYALIFQCTATGPVILAVAHGSREPVYWRDRYESNPPASDML